MIGELNRKLEKLAPLLARKKHVTDRLQKMRQEDERITEQAGVLYRRLRKEDRDVERLKTASLSTLLLELRGAKDDRMRKEKQEALEARYRYREAKQQQKKVQAEVASVQAELKRLEGVETAYTTLLKEKQKLMGAEDRQAAEELERFIRREEGLMEKLQKLEEVLEAGERAYSLIVQSMGFQRKAYKAGVKDIASFSEDDVIVSEDKHTYLLRSNLMATRARNALRKFHQSLGGVPEVIDIPEIRIDETLKALDCSLRGDWFAVDLIVQSKIRELLEDTQAAQDRLMNLVTPLRKAGEKVKAELGKTRRKRLDFVRKYA